MSLIDYLMTALIERYGYEAVCRMLDDAENGDMDRKPGPADVPAEVRDRVLFRLGELRHWRPYPDHYCRPVSR